PQIGVSHAGNPTASCAPGTMQHVAFNVDSDADLLAMRDRIRSRGIQVLGPLDHGLCKSIYFAGPENLSLEIASSAEPIDARAWGPGQQPLTLAKRFRIAADFEEPGTVCVPRRRESGAHAPRSA